MANKTNISINSKPGYGYTLTRTSYDVRQEINAKVIGVLKYNNDIRENLLKRNIGKYKNSNLNEGIGYISNFYSLESSKPISLGEEGLLGYTHITESDFQGNINQKYNFGDSIQYYQHGSLPDKNSIKWNGNYNNYTDYIDEVFGLKMTSLNLLSNLFQIDKLKNMSNGKFNNETSLTIQSILNDFIQYDNIKYAMEKTRIGTISPNPLASLSGSVVTNINNFSGTDTKLGLITNHLYAHALKNGAQFNSLRKTPYITSEVYDLIGNKLSTLSVISSDFRIDESTGRLAYEFGSDIITENYEKITIDDFQSLNMIDNTKDLSSSKNARYRNLIRNFNLPFIDKQYSTNKSSKTVYGNVSPVLRLKVYNIWNEGDKNIWNDSPFLSYYENGFSELSKDETNNGLLEKTRELYTLHNENGIDTLVGRFHTSGGRDLTHNESSLFQTAVTKYGMSHGRNLLNRIAYENKYAQKVNGYTNPYCRTWTYHHQYHRIGDLIRPFSSEFNGKESITDIDVLQHNWWMYGRRKGSASSLKDNSVLNRNGFINITPTIETDSKNNINIKKCMFSIENLAWKDVLTGNNDYNLSPEQTGPNGGRIMWFPPYDLKFNENVNVNWSQNEFIGRGEKIYTYTNTERSGTLSFMLLVDHPSILDMWKKNTATKNDVDDEQAILRFFAGCEELELDNIPINIDEESEEQKPQYNNVVTTRQDEDESKDIVFYIFFPNNYSGKDDLSFKESLNYITNYYESDNGGGYEKPVYDGYKWYYRVDSDYLNENMTIDSNFKDNTNFNLNKDLNVVKKSESYNDATISFQEISNMTSDVLDGLIITEATVQGFASSHGKINNNQKLQDKRASFAKTFIENVLNVKNVKKISGSVIDVNIVDKQNISGDSAKRARCAKIILKTKKRPKIESLTQITTPNITSLIETPEQLTINRTIEVNDIKLTRKQKRAIKKSKKKAQKNMAEDMKNSAPVILNNEMFNNVTNSLNETSKQNLMNQINGSLTRLLNENKILNATQSDEKRKKILDELDKIPQQRWDSEAQYFEMLKDNDSFLYDRIIDKIKYFTPAFHSITPEGFNSRLSFLHQCTRQGLTCSVSDNRNELRSAGNLAFGRPPICVLRIGDFYHTKIIIESVTIDYENPQWDMNPEGIGVQPMFARISLNFKFLGGSDIEAPISRLQNAVSFNYYANQSIYDDRSDIGIYDIEKKTPIIKGIPWKPNTVNVDK